MMAAAMSFQPSMEYQMDGTVNGISKWNPIIDSNIEMCVCVWVQYCEPGAQVVKFLI